MATSKSPKNRKKINQIKEHQAKKKGGGKKSKDPKKEEQKKKQKTLPRRNTYPTTTHTIPFTTTPNL